MSTLKSVAVIASAATIASLALASAAFAAPPEPGNAEGTMKEGTEGSARVPMMKEGAGVRAPLTESKLDATRASLRDLVVNHAFWVRNYVVGQIDGVASAQKEAEKQVLANAKAIASAFEPYYGRKASDKLYELLGGHYGDVKAYLEATLNNNSQHQRDAADRLNHNAEEIAVFLSDANPNLTKQNMQDLLMLHGKDHMEQIQQFHAKDYPAEAETWGHMTHHLYVFADALADGLYKQFPAQF